MKYLNTMSEYIKEYNTDTDDNKIKVGAILYQGLKSVARNSHIVSNQINNNIDSFINELNLGKLNEAIGGNINEVLGYGVFGCVFGIDNGDVVKFTLDYREAPFLYEYGLKNRKKGIVKVKKVLKIKFGESNAYLIVRTPLKFIKNTKLINDVIYDLKKYGINEEMIQKYRELGGIRHKVFLALKAMYDIDPNWRGTHAENIAKQKSQVVLYDGFSKNIKLPDEDIPFLDLSKDEVSESMVHKKSLEQLQRVRDMMKGIDIGDRVSDQSFPNQTSFHNVNDVHIQSYEEYMDEPFEVNQNVKNFKPKK